MILKKTDITKNQENNTIIINSLLNNKDNKFLELKEKLQIDNNNSNINNDSQSNTLLIKNLKEYHKKHY